MGNSEVFFFLFFLFFFFFFFFFFQVIYATCPIFTCGNNSVNDPTIRFPFQLEDPQPQNCGYPGFILSCNNQSIAVLKLPHSGELFVRNIDYLTQQILLSDPNNCLSRRFLLGFNLSGSPFMASYYQNYTFLSCPTQLIKSRFTPIDCLSNSTTSVLASSSMSFVKSMSSRSCNVIASLPIPVSWPVQNEGGLSSDLGNDLVLTWNVPDCRDCESQGGMCGLESNTSQEIGCFYDPGTGDTSQSGDGLHIFKILVLSITIPAITSTIAIALFICFTDRGGRTTLMSAPTAVTPQPTIVTTGLDDTTIESYTKLVLGESRRLPGPNDITCPICLSEYRTKETLRCIPECKHCFHADCIDEWLRLNGTCPVCRMSPSPTHVN